MPDKMLCLSHKGKSCLLRHRHKKKKKRKMFENMFLTLNKVKTKAQQQGETSCYIQFHIGFSYIFKVQKQCNSWPRRTCMFAIHSGGMLQINHATKLPAYFSNHKLIHKLSKRYTFCHTVSGSPEHPQPGTHHQKHMETQKKTMLKLGNCSSPVSGERTALIIKWLTFIKIFVVSVKEREELRLLLCIWHSTFM